VPHTGRRDEKCRFTRARGHNANLQLDRPWTAGVLSAPARQSRVHDNEA
jgi:hypothetical protein